MDVFRGLGFLLLALTRALCWAIVKAGKALRWLAIVLLNMRRSTTFGSARWAGLWTLLWNGALGQHGLIVGKAWRRFIRFNGDGALLVYAPQGSGKGVGIVVPNILDHRGSLIVTDPKGENAGVTSRYRAMLGKVYRINVIESGISDQFNPLSMIRVGTPFEAEDAAMIADLLVVPESHDGHWDTSAKYLIAAVLQYIVRTCRMSCKPSARPVS